MTLTQTSHWNILATPWRISPPWSFSRWLMGLLAFGAVACFLAGAYGANTPVAQRLLTSAGLVCANALWWVTSVRVPVLNAPVAARTVPHQLRRLRQTVVGVWLFFVATTGVALVTTLGHGPGAVLLSGLVLALPLLATRFVWQMGYALVLWSASQFLGARNWLWVDVTAWGQALFALQPVGITLVGLLGLGWLLAMVVLRSGGPAHAAAFARAARMTTHNALLKPNDFLAGTGLEKTQVVRPFGFYLKFALRHAQATPANVLRRVDAAIVRPELALVYIVGLACVALVVASGTWFVSETTATQLMGLMALFTLLLSHHVRMVGLQTTAKVLPLFLLLPAMPTGTSLHRRLALRHLWQSLGIWFLVVLISWAPSLAPERAGVSHWNGTWQLLLVVGWLPMVSEAVGRWQMHTTLSSIRIFELVMRCLLGPICLIAYTEFAVPISTIIAVVLLGTTAELTWRWTRLSLPDKNYTFYSAT